MIISKRGSRQYPKLKGGHHPKLSQEGLHPKCNIYLCILSRLSTLLTVGMSMFQLILSILSSDILSNQKGSTLESRKDDNLLPLPNPTMNDTSTLLFLYWKLTLSIMRSLIENNQTIMVRLHLRLKQMDSQLNNYHKFQSDMKFLKNRECSNVGIQYAQNMQSSLTAHA